MKSRVMFFAALLFCGTTMMLTSCSKVDNNVGAIPQKMEPMSDPDLESLRQNLIGTWLDTENAGILGYTKGVAFDDYGNVQISYYIPVNSDDITEIKEADIVNVSYHGKWKIVNDLKDRWTGSDEMCIGIAMELQPMSHDDKEIFLDTLLVSINEEGQFTFLTDDEIDQIDFIGKLALDEDDVEEAQAVGRSYMHRSGFLDKLAAPFKYVGKLVKNTWDNHIVPAVKKVGETLLTVGKNVLEYYHTSLNAIFKVLSFDTSTKKVTPSLADWMGTAFPPTGTYDPLVSDISMPGTHDSFTFTLNEFFGNWMGKTQFYDIKTQWELGVRCFDVRINELEGFDRFTSAFGYGFDQKLGIYHGPIYLQRTLRSGLESIVDMVKKHPNETAIIIMKFENHENEQNKAEVRRTLDFFKDHIVFNPRPGLRLSQCRGKVLILQRYEESKSNFAHMHATAWPQNGWSKIQFSNDATEDLYVQDMYEVPKNMNRKEFWNAKEAAFESVIKMAADDNRKNTWFINHESAYVGVINYASNAYEMVPRILNILDKEPYKNKRAGIVVTDFAGFKGQYDKRLIDCTQLTVKVIGEHNPIPVK